MQTTNNSISVSASIDDTRTTKTNGSTGVGRRENAANDRRMEQCPRFQTCEAPCCPLDELWDVRVKLPGDEACSLRKADRLRLGADLPKHGLFQGELAAIMRFYGTWESYESHLDEKRRRSRSTDSSDAQKRASTDTSGDARASL